MMMSVMDVVDVDDGRKESKADESDWSLSAYFG